MENAWIELCAGDADIASTDRQREYLQIDGSRRWLRLTEAPGSDCASRPLGTGIDNVRWFGLIPERQAAWLPRGVILQGLESAGRVQISEVVVAEPSDPRRSPLPLSTDLLGRLNPRVYGIEERARVEQDGDSLHLNCQPGERPAGLVLRNTGARLPEAIQMNLSFRYTADAPFAVGFADGVDHLLETPHQLGRLPVPAQSHTVTYALPDVAPRGNDSNATVTFMCPQTTGRLVVTDLQLQSQSVSEPPPRSTWIWRPAEWLEQPESLLAELAALATPSVYVSVPIDEDRVAHAEALARFIESAAGQGVAVWAVEGDPHAVLPDGQTAFVRRAEALAAFNASQPVDRRLRGIQYDIEPYLLPDFALHTDDWLRAYLQTIGRLDNVLDAPLEVAVPFWWASLELGDQPLLDALAPHVQGLNVMNYRTDPEQLQQFAEPFLAWGGAHGKAVRIALEAGPIQDETRWHFRADSALKNQNTLWHLQLADAHLLLLLDAPAVVPAAEGYRFVRQSQLAGSRLTFSGDRPRMEQLMQSLEVLWAAWPSFAGLALHEYRLQGE